MVSRSASVIKYVYIQVALFIIWKVQQSHKSAFRVSGSTLIMDVLLLNSRSNWGMVIRSGVVINYLDYGLSVAWPAIHGSLEGLEKAGWIYCFIFGEYFIVAYVLYVRYECRHHPTVEFTWHCHQTWFLPRALLFSRLVLFIATEHPKRVFVG